MRVIKRDGREAAFDRDKIRDAIAGANGDFGENEGIHVTQDEIGQVVDAVANRLLGGDAETASVEDIQNLVEKTLMDSGHTDVARAYVRYRYDREKARLAKTRLIKDFKKKVDYSEYGGAPLLGTAKPVIKAHGSSDAKAFYNAIRQAKLFTETKAIDTMKQALSQIKQEASED